MRIFTIRKSTLGTPLAWAIIFLFSVLQSVYVRAGDEGLSRLLDFDIPAGELGQALHSLANQADINLSFKQSVVTGKVSRALTGESTISEAIQQLLSGTGLIFSQIDLNSGIVTLGPENHVVTLSPIRVYGTKVERSYLKTPDSVGVVTGQDLKEYSVTDVRDVFNRIANVSMLDANGGNDTFSIRGVNGDGVAAEVANSVTAISVVIDGALQNSEGSRRGFRSMWDMKQIEALRGPQSSLYGRAALAGALVIESNGPTYEWEGALRYDVGSHESLGRAAMLSGPILDQQVAFRLSYEDREIENDIRYTDSDLKHNGNDEFNNFRGKLLIEPDAIPKLSVLLSFNSAFDSPASELVDGPNYYDRELGDTADFGEIREIEVDNYVANIAYELSESYTLRSVSAMTDTSLEISSVPGSIVFDRFDVRSGDDITQELRLEIDDSERGVSGVIGLYVGSFETSTNANWDVDLTYATCSQGYLGPDTSPATCLGIAETQPRNFQSLIVGGSKTEISTQAVFADIRYDLNDRYTLIAGLRNQIDEVENQSDTTGLLASANYDIDARFNVILPKIGLSYDLSLTETVATTLSRGYRQGFTERNVSGQNDVDPEFVNTLEVAYRKESVRPGEYTFGANIFYNNYQDLQVVSLDPNTFATLETLNASSAESYGVEFDGRYRVASGIDIFGSLGWLRTKIKDLENPVDCANSGGNCEGNEFPEAPELTMAVGVSWLMGSGLFMAVDANYTDKYYSGGHIDSNDSYQVDSRWLLNSKLGYQMNYVTVSIFAKNMLDEEYLTSINPVSGQAGIGDSALFGFEILAEF